MSTKPTFDGTWDSNLTNTIAVIAGHKTGGYVNSEIPTSAEMNTWMNGLGLWSKYLLDADVTASGLILPSVDVTIANAQTDNWNPGVGGASPICVIRMKVGGASAVISGITGGVDGRIVVLINVTGNPVGVVHQSGSNATNWFTLGNGGLAPWSIPVNSAVALRYDGNTTSWMVVWASFAYDSAPTIVEVIPAALAQPDVNTNWSSGLAGRWTVIAAGGFLTYPIRLPFGSVLRSWKLYCNKGSAGTITCQLVDQTSATAAGANVGAAQTNNVNAPGNIVLKDAAANLTFAVGHSCYLKVSDTATASDSFYDLEISYTRVFMPVPTIYVP